MIDWATIKNTAKSLVVDLTGARAAWEDEPEGVTFGTDPVIFMRISSLGDDGVAPEIKTPAESSSAQLSTGSTLSFMLGNNLGGPLIPVRSSAGTTLGFKLSSVMGGSVGTLEDNTVTVSAQKHFTLGLRCESFNQDIASGKHAGAILETLKTRLARTTTSERIRGIFAVQNTLGNNWFNYKNQGRQVSCYTMDLLCATVDNDIDSSIDAGDFINEVQLASKYVNGPDGQPTASQVSLDVNGGP